MLYPDEAGSFERRYSGQGLNISWAPTRATYWAGQTGADGGIDLR
jgi:hypothetical protein